MTAAQRLRLMAVQVTFELLEHPHAPGTAQEVCALVDSEIIMAGLLALIPDSDRAMARPLARGLFFGGVAWKACEPGRSAEYAKIASGLVEAQAVKLLPQILRDAATRAEKDA